MPKTPLRELREAAGITQAELASRAGVSRQLVGAVEAGRHLPRVDAALALAQVLGVQVDLLFDPQTEPVDAVSGGKPAAGSLVRTGRVGDRTVTAPARVGAEGWGVADGVIDGGVLTSFARHAPGLVVAGCEPGLEALERMLREAGMAALAATASSAAALQALSAGRIHAAVVHWPEHGAAPELQNTPVERFHLVRWQVGLAASPEASSRWWQSALSGRTPVVQREQGAGVQRTFERAVVEGRGPVPGPRVASHLEAARRSVMTGTPAVTIEPAALAVGARFHAIETHEAELWVARRWLSDRVVTEALNVISGQGFQRRLGAVGGYDLSDCARRVA